MASNTILLTAMLALLSAAAVRAERVSDPAVLEQGRAVYEQNCAVCHGPEAEGLTEDWRKTDADGKYPPPPLNGTAHAWHHPLSQLARVVREGTARLGGSMPAWGGTLSDGEIENTLHYLISLWPEDIAREWEERGGYQ